MHQGPTSPSTLRKLVAAIATIAVLVTAAATSALAASAVDTLVETNSSTGNLGSTATEWSGATYNPSRNVIFTVDDETGAYEFTLLPDGTINPNAPVRELTIALGGTSDFEGVAWITGDRYAILSEGTGVAYVVDVPSSGTTIDNDDLVETFDAGGPDGNTGSEGIGVGSDGSFYVTDEMPASVSKYDSQYNFVGTVLLPEIGDATGVVAAQDDTLVVISHESQKAIHIEVDWDQPTPTRTQIGEIDLGDFTQLEGVAILGNEQLHFFGELKPGGGQTYSQMVGTIVTPDVDTLDVNCSGTVDIVDALIISRIEVGTSAPNPACGVGDANDDGATTVVDALLIARCVAGLPSIACPAG